MCTKVLVIDDEEQVRACIAACLDAGAVLAVTATDGATGIALYREDATFTHIICDFVMPGVNGYGVYAAVQDLLRVRGTTFVLCTGGTTDPRLCTQLDMLRRQPGVRELGKPFRMQELYRVVACDLAAVEA